MDDVDLVPPIFLEVTEDEDGGNTFTNALTAFLVSLPNTSRQ